MVASVTLLVIAVSTFPGTVSADGPAASTPADPPTGGFRAEYLGEISRFEERVLALAEAIPEDRFSWRCSEGSPSLAEQFARLAATTYRTLQSLEREPDIDPEDLKTIADKKRLIETLDQGSDAIRRAVIETRDRELDLPIDHLGRRWSVRSIYLLLYGQLQEGLGQIAATASCGGMDPPWVRTRRAEAATDD